MILTKKQKLKALKRKMILAEIAKFAYLIFINIMILFITYYIFSENKTFLSGKLKFFHKIFPFIKSFDVDKYGKSILGIFLMFMIINLCGDIMSYTKENVKNTNKDNNIVYSVISTIFLSLISACTVNFIDNILPVTLHKVLLPILCIGVFIFSSASLLLEIFYAQLEDFASCLPPEILQIIEQNETISKIYLEKKKQIERHP